MRTEALGRCCRTVAGIAQQSSASGRCRCRRCPGLYGPATGNAPDRTNSALRDSGHLRRLTFDAKLVVGLVGWSDLTEEHPAQTPHGRTASR